MVEIVLTIALGIAALAAALAAFQLLRGPDAPTRAVSLDTLTLITLPMIVGLAIATGRGVLIDVAMVYGLLSFLGILTLARYFDRGL